MGVFSAIGSAIMTPLYYAISGIMLGWHWLLSLVLDPEGGLAWALSIIGLTIVIRVLLIPLFVKQIKSQRNMQLIQPKVKELQKKYGHDRQKLGEETMKLYREAGTNPFASCLPLILQMPIFFALFRLLDQAAKNNKPHGFLNEKLAKNFGDSEIFGVIPISESFWNARVWGASPDLTVMLVAVVLVIAMTATTFTTQRQLMSKNMPADALSGPYAQQQKVLLYVLPLVFGISGVAFPIGVLLYWTTSNLWTMGQQFYVIRNNPAPGTPAFKAKEQRDQMKSGASSTAVAQPESEAGGEADGRPSARQQPKRQTKAQRRANQRAETTVTPTAPGTRNGGPSLDKPPGGATSAGSAPKKAVSKKKSGKKQGGRR